MAEKKVIEIDIESNIGSLKSQLREAQAEVANLSDKFGATSKEAAEAAKRAAELKDKIGDAKALTDAFNPDAKFNALSASIGGVLNGFQAYEGALGLIGVESEQVQATLLKVQSAMALSQGLQGIGEAKDSFIRLGATIKNLSVVQKAYNFVVYGTTSATAAQTVVTEIQTGATTGATVATKALRIAMLALPILLIVAGLAALANAMGVFGDETEDAEKKQARLDKQLEKTNEELERQKRNSEVTADIINRLNKQELIDAKNRGASEQELTKIQKEQAKERLKTLEDEYNQARKFYLKISRTYTDRKQVEEAEKAFNEAFKNYNNLRLEIEEATADEVYNKRKEAIDKANELRKSELAQIKEFYKTAKAENEARLRTEQEQEEFVITEKYKTEIALFKKYGKDTTELEVAQLNELNDIRLKYQKIDYDNKEELRKKELEAIKEANQKRIELEDKQFETMQSIGQTEKEKEIADLVKSYEDKFAIVGNNAELEKQLTEQQKKDLAIIEDKYKKSQEEKEKESLEKAKQLQQQRVDLILKYAQTFGQAMSSLNGLLNANDEQRLKSVKQGSKEEAEIKKKMFDRDKKLRIVQTVIDTASNVVTSVRNGGGIPSGIPFGIAAATMGALQVAAISKSSFDGGGNIQSPSGSTFTPSFNVVGNSGINQLASLNQQPIKAYVTAGDVSSALSLERNTLQKSTF